jgi:metal-dependent amidase/aminoacylase/carboxypeptidase family protein
MFIKQALEELKMETKRIDLMFSGEDFSFYLQEVPGSFWILGAKQEEAWDHHTSKFNPDEAYLKDGLAFWLLLAERIPPQ